MAHLTRRIALIWAGAAISGSATEAFIGPLAQGVLSSSRSQRDETAEQLLPRTNPTEAAAHAGINNVVVLLGGAATVITILDFLGISGSSNAKHVSYEHAGACKHNFQLAEKRMRDSGMTDFFGVVRSPHDREI